MSLTLVSVALWHFAVSPQLSAQPLVAQQQSVATSRNTAPQAHAAPLVFTRVTIIDVTDGRLVPDQTVIVTGNRVQTIGPVDKVSVPVGAKVVEARGKYLIPGLWDMHVHVDNHSQRYYPRFVANGVTGIREMAQRFSSGADSFRVWQHEVLAGIRVGPRPVGPSADLNYNNGIAIRTPEDARRVMDSLKAAGDVFAKYHDDRGDRNLFLAIAREARRVGLPLVGHVPFTVTSAEASDSGMPNIEHANENRPCWPGLRYLDSVEVWESAAMEQRCAPMVKAYVRNGTWMTPALVVVETRRPKDFQGWRRVVRTMYHLGFRRFLAGSDITRLYWQSNGVLPGFSLLQEMVLLAESGLTPLEALQTTTLNPAKFFAATDSLGTVAAGKLADLVLLDANPLIDIKNVMKIQAVVANGRYFDRATLDAMDSEGVERIKAASTGP
jgi:hypothetical protein